MFETGAAYGLEDHVRSVDAIMEVPAEYINARWTGAANQEWVNFWSPRIRTAKYAAPPMLHLPIVEELIFSVAETPVCSVGEAALKLDWTISVSTNEYESGSQDGDVGPQVYFCAAWCPIGFVARMEERREGRHIWRLFTPDDANSDLSGRPSELDFGTSIGLLNRRQSPVRILYQSTVMSLFEPLSRYQPIG